MRPSEDLRAKSWLTFQWAGIRKRYSHGTICDFFSMYGATIIFMLRDGFDSNSHTGNALL